MIDRTKAKKAFKEYVLPYDVQNPKIAIKIAHTYRTAEVAEDIAKSIGLDEKNIDLAWIMGLLHDIGRFEQLRIYDTFDDQISIDHADFGVKVLFEDGVIRKFINDVKYDEIIYKAIQNHNKYEIEEGLTNEELLHAKIIRDADKTDIFGVHLKELEKKENVLYQEENIRMQKISEEVMKEFLAYRPIHRKYVKNDMDRFVVIIAFIYDYYYKRGLEIIRENQYIERMIKTVECNQEAKEQLELVKQTAFDFLEKNIEKKRG